MSVRSALADRFAHFRGLGVDPSAAKPKEEKEKDRRDGESDDEYKERKAKEKKADDDAADEEARRAAASKSRRAKGKKKDDDDDDDEEDEEDEAGDDEEDDDDDEDMKKASAAGHGAALDAAFRVGARAQRRRMTKILSAPVAATNVALAVQLACETPLNPKAALGVIDKAPVATTNRLAARGTQAVPPNGAQRPTGPAATAASWDAAMSQFVPKP